MTDLDLLNHIVERRATEEFVDSYIAETPLAQRRLEAMGIMLAEWLNWSYKSVQIVTTAAFNAIDSPLDIMPEEFTEHVKEIDHANQETEI